MVRKDKYDCRYVSSSGQMEITRKLLGLKRVVATSDVSRKMVCGIVLVLNGHSSHLPSSVESVWQHGRDVIASDGELPAVLLTARSRQFAWQVTLVLKEALRERDSSRYVA